MLLSEHVMEIIQNHLQSRDNGISGNKLVCKVPRVQPRLIQVQSKSASETSSSLASLHKIKAEPNEDAKDDSRSKNLGLYSVFLHRVPEGFQKNHGTKSPDNLKGWGETRARQLKAPRPRVAFLKDNSSSSPRASFRDNLDRTKIVKLYPPIMTAEVLGPVAPWVSSHSLLQLLQISVACLPTSIPLPWLERNGNI